MRARIVGAFDIFELSMERYVDVVCDIGGEVIQVTESFLRTMRRAGLPVRCAACVAVQVEERKRQEAGAK